MEQPLITQIRRALEYLNDLETRYFMKQLHRYFESKVEVPRIRVGKWQTIETLINEEALLFVKYFRNERETWNPRIAIMKQR